MMTLFIMRLRPSAALKQLQAMTDGRFTNDLEPFSYIDDRLHNFHGLVRVVFHELIAQQR